MTVLYVKILAPFSQPFTAFPSYLLCSTILTVSDSTIPMPFVRRPAQLNNKFLLQVKVGIMDQVQRNFITDQALQCILIE